MSSDRAKRTFVGALGERTRFACFGPPETLPIERFSPLLGTVFEYWRLMARGRAAPTRRDIDPIDIPRALANLMLWDVGDCGNSFSCRLAGTAICDFAGRELRGQRIDAMHWEPPAQATAEYRTAALDMVPYYVERQLAWPERSISAYRRLLLPLSEDRRQTSMLIGVVQFE